MLNIGKLLESESNAFSVLIIKIIGNVSIQIKLHNSINNNIDKIDPQTDRNHVSVIGTIFYFAKKVYARIVYERRSV